MHNGQIHVGDVIYNDIIIITVRYKGRSLARVDAIIDSNVTGVLQWGCQISWDAKYSVTPGQEQIFRDCLVHPGTLGNYAASSCSMAEPPTTDIVKRVFPDFGFNFAHCSLPNFFRLAP